MSFSTGCPDIYHFTNSSGNLKSPKPHGSLLYPYNTSCNWTITIPGSHVHVQLSFKTFHLENCIDCKCDYVEVFDYTGPKQSSLGKFCGSVLPGPFFSSQQTLSIVFKSDHGNSFTGFTASFSSVLPGTGSNSQLVYDAWWFSGAFVFKRVVLSSARGSWVFTRQISVYFQFNFYSRVDISSVPSLFYMDLRHFNR